MTEDEALNSGGSLYRHYKGGIYRLMVDATHSETQEEMIVYKHVWPHEPRFWVRPADMFFDYVTLPDGQTVRRFQLILPTPPVANESQ